MPTQKIATSTENRVPKKIKLPLKIFDFAKYRSECTSCLGSVGAMVFFVHSALRPKVDGEFHADLLGWTCQLRTAIEKKKEIKQPQAQNFQLPSRNPKISRVQISTWRRANSLVTEFSPDEAAGLVYRVLNVQVSGEPAALPDPAQQIPGIESAMVQIEGQVKTKESWSANLIFIYEMKTKRLFHHHVSLKKFRVTKDQLLYVIAKADVLLCKEPVAAPYLEMKKTLVLPIGINNEDSLIVAYDEVSKIFQAEAKNNKLKIFEWNTVKSQIKFDNWIVESNPTTFQKCPIDEGINAYPRRKVGVVKHRLNAAAYQIDSARALGNALNRFASGMSNWISLSPPKAKKRLYWNRFSGKEPLIVLK